MKFHLGDVLSITTGYLVSPRLIDGVYDILNFMTGDSLFNHQLPRAGRQCTPVLLQQFPQLADVKIETLETMLECASDSQGRKAACEMWLASQVALFGEWFEVQPLADYRPIDPFTELIEMRNGGTE